jgi:hypothetical protein
MVYANMKNERLDSVGWSLRIGTHTKQIDDRYNLLILFFS